MISYVLLLSLAGTPLVIDNAKVEVGDGTTLDQATVVVDNGRISYVGVARREERGTHIDARGKVLTPGLIDTLSHLGLIEVDQEVSTNDFESHDDALVPAFTAADGFNPASVLIPVARADGITTAVTAPTGGILSGTGAWVDTAGRLDRRPRRNEPIAMFGSVGINAAKVAGGTRSTTWMRLRQFLTDARYFEKNREAVLKGQANRQVPPPIQLEAMAPVVARKIPLVLTMNRASDILAALDFAREEDLRLIVAGGAESWRVADALAKQSVPVILTPSMQAPESFETLAARDDVAAALDRAGVQVIVSTASPGHLARRLRQEAGIAVAYGLPRPKALAAITSVPAAVFGRGQEVGAVRVGAQADLVLWSGDPLELSTVAERVWIAGTEQSLETRQKALARRYAKRPLP